MRIHIEGSQPLSGIYEPSGSVNTAIALLAASLLTDQPVVLRAMPRASIVLSLVEVAQNLGAQVQWDDGDLHVQTQALTRRVLTQDDTKTSVGAVMLLAPILIQRQHARLEVDFPLNRIRTHLDALRDLGFDLKTHDGAVECHAQPWATRNILLAQTSVTATALVMMLAAGLGDVTTIYNAACEPQIQTLASFLTALGAQIDGAGSNIVHIRKAPAFRGAEIRIPPDHIEAASIAAIAAATGGRVEVRGVQAQEMGMIRKVYQRFGITLDIDKESIFVPRHEALSISNRDEDQDAAIETAPWPGFPSDLVGVATVLATQARGTLLIHEKLFSNRLIFVDKLKAMGAQIVLCDPHRAIVVGATPLNATYMDSPDVRTGFGLLMAALVARGTTVIDNAHTFDQWFVGAFDKLRGLNAHIDAE